MPRPNLVWFEQEGISGRRRDIATGARPTLICDEYTLGEARPSERQESVMDNGGGMREAGGKRGGWRAWHGVDGSSIFNTDCCLGSSVQTNKIATNGGLVSPRL